MATIYPRHFDTRSKFNSRIDCAARDTGHRVRKLEIRCSREFARSAAARTRRMLVVDALDSVLFARVTIQCRCKWNRSKFWRRLASRRRKRVRSCAPSRSRSQVPKTRWRRSATWICCGAKCEARRRASCGDPSRRQRLHAPDVHGAAGAHGHDVGVYLLSEHAAALTHCAQALPLTPPARGPYTCAQPRDRTPPCSARTRGRGGGPTAASTWPAP